MTELLQNLLKEGVSIRDLSLVLEVLSHSATKTKSPVLLTELTRKSLARTITERNVDADGTITEIFRGSTKDDRFFYKSWSPDGSKIVWGTSDNLHVGDVAEGTYHSLNLNVVSPLAPSWSPDGTRILFNGSLAVRAMLMEDFLPETNGTK